MLFKRKLTKHITTCKDFLSIDRNRLSVALLSLGFGASMLASVYLKVPNQNQGGTNES